MGRWNLAASVLVLAGLAWAIMEVRALRGVEPHLAGQSLTRGGVTTERYVDEPIDAWVGRHMEAERRFYKP